MKRKHKWFILPFKDCIECFGWREGTGLWFRFNIWSNIQYKYWNLTGREWCSCYGYYCQHPLGCKRLHRKGGPDGSKMKLAVNDSYDWEPYKVLFFLLGMAAIARHQLWEFAPYKWLQITLEFGFYAALGWFAGSKLRWGPARAWVGFPVKVHKRNGKSGRRVMQFKIIDVRPQHRRVVVKKTS